MTDLINHMKGYSASVKVWNKTTFNDSIYAFPKKGFAPYNQVQKLRLGQDITPLKTVKQMEKPEEPIKIVKPKPEVKKEEAKKEEAKKDKPEAKKSQKKSKPKTQIVKEKAEKKEKVVKRAIQAIMKEEAPVNQVVETDDAPPTLVIKEVDDLDDLEKTVARMEALEKMAETSGYYKSEDGKKIQSEFLDLQKKLKRYEGHHEHDMLKKKNAELAKRVNGRVTSDRISGIWANRIYHEQEKAKEEADWKGFAARRRQSKKAGKLRGIGTAVFIEPSGGGGMKKDEVAVLFDKDGRATIRTIGSFRAGHPREQAHDEDGAGGSKGMPTCDGAAVRVQR
jgi:hypothetical protein